MGGCGGRILFSRIYILLFFTVFRLLMFHNKSVKISEILIKLNLLKTIFKCAYPIIFCSHFYFGKRRKYSIFKTIYYIKTVCA